MVVTTISPPSSPSGTGTNPFVIHVVPREFTTPVEDIKTDGHEIAWSRGDGETVGAPDLWSLTTQDETPRLVWRNPNRDSDLLPIAVNASRYAFVEQNLRLYGSGGWKLWFLPRAGGAPVGVDVVDWRAGEPAPPLPSITLAGNRLVWATLHHTADGLRFELMSRELDSGRTTVLAASKPSEIEYWFPALDESGEMLTYATVEHANAEVAFHVYLMDFSGASAVRRLDGDGLATNPVINAGWIAWRTVATAAGNVTNASDMVEFGSVTADSSSPLSIRKSAILGPITDLSAGSHYLAGWRWQDMDLQVVDVISGSPVIVDRIPVGDQPGLERPTIAGNLIAYLHGYMDAQPLQLSWVQLP